MKVLQQISDPVFQPRPYSKTDRFFLQFIRDERDLPFIYLLLKVSILIPIAILIYLPFTSWIWWLLVVCYHTVNSIFRASYGLMMHSISHRQLFKSRYKNLIYYITWILGPFVGHTPETYFSHHIGMHHPEGNMPEDDSSTMYYQRDSIRSFLKYLAEFLFTGMAGLISYLKRKNRKKLAQKALSGEVFFFVFCIGMCFINWQATTAVFLFTIVISRILMMLGNWTQHAFVDPQNPEDPYKSCINCLNIRYNHIAWNDGYHTSHHEKPTLHWTEHPHTLLRNLDKYAENRAVVFDGINYVTIFISLMRKRYDVLARNFVNINGVYKNDEEVIAMLKSRTQRFSRLPESKQNIAA